MPRWLKGVLVGVVTGAAFAVFGLTPLGTDFEKHVGLDWLFDQRGPVKSPQNVAVVAINQSASVGLGLAALPRDWPRSIHATLIEQLMERGASAIVFDMDFQHPKEGDGDATFAKAISESGRVVLAERLVGMRKPLFDLAGQQTGTFWTEQVIAPVPIIAESAIALATFTLPKVQANVYQYWAFKPGVRDAATMPAVALQVHALNIYPRWKSVLEQAGAPGVTGLPDTADDLNDDAAIARLMTSTRLIFAQDSKLETRIEKLLAKSSEDNRDTRLIRALSKLYSGKQNRYLNFYGPPGTIQTIPYNAMITGETPSFNPDLLDIEGKVVFIGFSDLFDPGQPDRFATVFTSDNGVDLSGVEIAATAFANLLSNQAIQPTSALETAAMLMLIGVLLGSSAYFLSAVIAVFLALVLSGIYIMGVQYVFNTHNLWLPLAIPVLLQLPMVLMSDLLIQYIGEARGRRHMKVVFGQYVPPEIVDEMSRHPDDDFSVEGEIRELSVLFCDIRDFTTASESLAADDLKKLLNHYLTPMTRTIFEHHGTIDKYVGDMIMAFWGAPVHDPQHRKNAVSGALSMLDQLHDIRLAFKNRGWPEINIGIGINTGMMNVGDMGSEYRRAYTVIGDAVNLGSRLEGLTTFYGVPLIIGETTAENLDGIVLRRLDRVLVKGKKDPVTIYEAVATTENTSPELIREIDESNHALDEYFAANWQAALVAFQALYDAYLGHQFYKLYLDRINDLQSQDLAESWDGVYVYQSKVDRRSQVKVSADD